MQITRIIDSGELQFTTYEELIENAGRALDKSSAHDIVGRVIFEADDGKTYVMTVEAVVGEANPEYLQDVLDEIEDEESDHEEIDGDYEDEK